jgi:hypothetical protein
MRPVLTQIAVFGLGLMLFVAFVGVLTRYGS